MKPGNIDWVRGFVNNPEIQAQLVAFTVENLLINMC